ncbi:hypothetical protein GBAR_LOCUS13927 [Geodia barretti]|uniref:Uncharacterized protein n=1 Tax=Geodia barretti TaxID=519541 RepID=A0AA35S6I8_GEOBA|nr:hypothetical protein GBAR_LOCUS13927 [Geodia barretti]
MSATSGPTSSLSWSGCPGSASSLSPTTSPSLSTTLSSASGSAAVPMPCSVASLTFLAPNLTWSETSVSWPTILVLLSFMPVEDSIISTINCLYPPHSTTTSFLLCASICWPVW